MSTAKKGIIQALEKLIADSEGLTDKLKILLVGTEAAPYATVGGFSSVLAYLSRALVSKGHDVRIFMPKFYSIDEETYQIEMLYEGLKVPTDDPDLPYLICNVKIARNPTGVPVYFLENQEYYEKRANVYGYSDDPTRWALLSRGVLEFIKTGSFVPDVIHTNDWHTGIVSNYLKTTYAHDRVLSKISTVFTIHNMKFQGLFDHNNVPELDLDDGRSQIAPLFSDRLVMQNFLRRGILYSDVVNTVSRKYAREVLTPEYGESLDRLLLEVKGKFFGIVNGIDYTEFDPRTDKLIAKNSSVKSLDNRVENKKALQKEFDLKVDPKVPLFGFIGRLDYQKGVDLIVNTMHHALKDYDIQFIQLGGGDASLVHMLQNLRNTFPDKVSIHPYPNFSLPRLLFAGSDVILYPSRFEPCGVVQLEAMRYGAVPLVREVGGLADTVTNFDSNDMTGNGLIFKDFNEFALFGQLVRAVELYKHPSLWSALQKNGMKSDYSWSYSASEYVKLYELSLSLKSKIASSSIN